MRFSLGGHASLLRDHGLELSVLRPGLFELGVEFVDLLQTRAEQGF
jgi:hypothetical protein